MIQIIRPQAPEQLGKTVFNSTLSLPSTDLVDKRFGYGDSAEECLRVSTRSLAPSIESCGPEELAHGVHVRHVTRTGSGAAIPEVGDHQPLPYRARDPLINSQKLDSKKIKSLKLRQM